MESTLLSSLSSEFQDSQQSTYEQINQLLNEQDK